MIAVENNLVMMAIVIPAMALLLYLGLKSFRLFFSYEIREKDILVRLFHYIPIYWIPFKKIVAMHNRPLHEVMLVPGVHLFTRLFARNVVIEQKDRWFIFAFLTPDDPDAFIAEVKKRMGA